MNCYRPILALFFIALPSCMTSALSKARHDDALPANEINRTPVVLTGRKVADSKYDVYRFQGWLYPREDKSPRVFDLRIPRKRTDPIAKIAEVKTSGNPNFTGDTIRASFDMRHTSRMMFDDPKCLKKTDLVIGESIADKGKLVSVGLREAGTTHHWYARLDLDWEKRDKNLHRAGNAAYAATVPADIGGWMAYWLLMGWL
jgi:hypothetical protein